MSDALQKLNEFEKPYPSFESLLGDIWGSLYKMRPKLMENTEVPDDLKTNHSFMERIMTDEKFDNYRKYTKLDELSSILATTKFGAKTKEWLEEQREENEKLNEYMNELQALQKQLQKQEKQHKAGQSNDQLQEDLQEAKENIHKEVDQQIQQNGGSLSKKISQAFQETKETNERVKNLVGGTQAGSGETEIKKVPLKDQLQLAEKISNQEHFKAIAEWAGRFKRIARMKQKSAHSDSVERSGVRLGNDIEKLLPSELALYSHGSTRLDFLRRYVERQTMTYDTKAKETLGKGPIILCLDQSGSMSDLDAQSKGFALALMSVAKKQKRDFCFIPFSRKVEVHRYPKGKIDTREMIRISESFLDGGTDFMLPLKKSLEVINESRFNKADIVFVTDGEAHILDTFTNDFLKVKHEKEFSVLSLLIRGDRTGTLEKFSDRVVQIKNLNDTGSYRAFEI
ncbi:VWA domain-containing protein [Oceanobacillus jeddahense]|nr:VWA domain-containing protein [Oceanobacillus jeddahense]